MNNCSICGELAAAGPSSLTAAIGKPHILNLCGGSTAHLAIIPSLGPLTQGHALMVTRYHATTLVGLTNNSILSEASTLLSEYFRVLDLPPTSVALCFEHAAPCADPRRVLCSTTHAHLHIVPVHTTDAHSILNRIGGAYPLVQSLGDLHNYSLPAEYIFAFIASGGGRINNARIVDAASLPSQFMRMMVAEQLELPEWNWKVDSRGDVVLDMAAELFRPNVSLLLPQTK